MDLQYISDAEGNHTAVVIPIKEWEALNDRLSELKKTDTNPKKLKPSDFAGSIPIEIGEAMQAYVKQSREEWG